MADQDGQLDGDSLAGVPIDNEVDSYEERPIDRFIHSAAGEIGGAAMTGFAKALGWAVEPEEVAVVREAGEPPRDVDDPIDIDIDFDHPENTKVVYRLPPGPDSEKPASTNG